MVEMTEGFKVLFSIWGGLWLLGLVIDVFCWVVAAQVGGSGSQFFGLLAFALAGILYLTLGFGIVSALVLLSMFVTAGIVGIGFLSPVAVIVAMWMMNR